MKDNNSYLLLMSFTSIYSSWVIYFVSIWLDYTEPVKLKTVFKKCNFLFIELVIFIHEYCKNKEIHKVYLHNSPYKHCL